MQAPGATNSLPTLLSDVAGKLAGEKLLQGWPARVTSWVRKGYMEPGETYELSEKEDMASG